MLTNAQVVLGKFELIKIFYIVEAIQWTIREEWLFFAFFLVISFSLQRNLLYFLKSTATLDTNKNENSNVIATF